MYLKVSYRYPVEYEKLIFCKRKKILKKFGARVRALRKSKGFSQEDFALEIELDRTYMGGVERGERNLALLNIRKLQKGLA